MRNDALLTTALVAGALAATPPILFSVYLATRLRGIVSVLQGLVRGIDTTMDLIGRAVMWLSLAMVVLQVAIVLLRYVFGEGRVFLQEAMLYMNGALFLAASAYTLLHDGHVRVDIVYRSASPRTKAIIDIAGAYLFLIPVVTVLFAVSFPYVRQSWLFGERSRETGGIPFVYGLKTFILVFCVLLFFQGLSLTIRNLMRLAGIERLPASQATMA